jgi:hypothetical protein
MPRLAFAKLCAHRLPLKQAVISPSALSLVYPGEDIPGYSRQEFIDDLLREHETEIRRCFGKRAHKVQIDFTPQFVLVAESDTRRDCSMQYL